MNMNISNAIQGNPQMARMLMVFALMALSIFEPAFANDPFAGVEDKGNELLDFLTGPFAILAVAIVLAIVGFFLLKGWIQVGWAISIAAGTILIGSAVPIATWLLNK